jgi:hypothetical protein
VSLLAFLAHRLRFLRDLIPLPQLLDLFFWLHALLFHRQRFRVLESLVAELDSWPEVRWQLHRFGGIEWRLDGREIGHVHGNGVLDVLLPTRAEAEAAILARRAHPHHTHPATAWVSLSVEDRATLRVALGLLTDATRNSAPGP